MRSLSRIHVFGACVVGLLSGCAGGTEGPWTVGRTGDAPEWALLQRELLEANAEGARVFMEEFLDERGYLTHVTRWGGNDGPDDAIENVHNWPLAYALGSPESLLEDYSRAWEGHLAQFTEAKAEGIPAAENGMYHREFITAFDWEHTGEGLQPFYFYGLARPDDPTYRERVLRYAGFYNGDDPEAPNYDPEHRIVRSLHNGSRGPKLTPATEQDWGGLPVPEDPGRLARYAEAANIVGDHPLNLLSTTLGLYAYMLTGEARYRDWVLDYAGAWRERILANGGNIPTNIGLDGTIGGEWEGRWYGGTFGWDFDSQQSSRNYFMRGPRVAMGNGLLLTGEQSWIEPLRRQMDTLRAVGRMQDGRLLLPNKHGDEGWYGYVPNRHGNVEHDLYLWSMREDDRARVADSPWISFLQGADPDYPVSSLRSELGRVRERVRAIREDPDTPEERWREWRSDSFYDYNPVATTALVNLTLGGSDPGNPGNALHTRLRYFDPQRRRAGLPEDVAALVTGIDAEGVELTLVNTSSSEPREVVLQAGAYGEHRFTTVRSGAGEERRVDAARLALRLEPGSVAELELGMRRYANRPTLEFPWD